MPKKNRVRWKKTPLTQRTRARQIKEFLRASRQALAEQILPATKTETSALKKGAALMAVRMLEKSIRASFLPLAEQKNQIIQWCRMIGLHYAAAAESRHKDQHQKLSKAVGQKIEQETNLLVVDSFFKAGLLTPEQKNFEEKKVEQGFRFFLTFH